jgi:hypothetical protein
MSPSHLITRKVGFFMARMSQKLTACYPIRTAIFGQMKSPPKLPCLVL